MKQLTEKQTQVITKIAALLPTSRPSWWPSDAPRRIYLNSGRKDAKIYIEFDDPAEVYGAAVRVWIDAGNQPSAWVASQKKRLAQWAIPAFYACLLIGKGEEDAAKFVSELADNDPESYADFVELVNQ